jgi:hypothetical protein
MFNIPLFSVAAAAAAAIATATAVSATEQAEYDGVFIPRRIKSVCNPGADIDNEGMARSLYPASPKKVLSRSENNQMQTKELQNSYEPEENRDLKMLSDAQRDLDLGILIPVENNSVEHIHRDLAAPCPTGEEIIQIQVMIGLDRNSHETSWYIQDYNGQNVITGGGYEFGMDGYKRIKLVYLCKGNQFTFVIDDSAGDGMSCYNPSHGYTVSTNAPFSSGVVTSHSKKRSHSWFHAQTNHLNKFVKG